MKDPDSEDLVIRPASAEEFATAVQWAANEGWNPGLDDLNAFHLADPSGFLIGWKGATPISSISVVRYGPQFGFIGFYIVHPDHRGAGAGLATWHAGMKHLADRTVGLDGVVDQQDNYRRSGFDYVHANVRYSGTVDLNCAVPADVDIRPLERSDVDRVLAFDRAFFPSARTEFLRAWIDPEAATRRTMLALRDGSAIGFATIRQCQAGFKVGPLFADDRVIAEGLLAAVCDGVPKDSVISVDVPLPNKSAVQMVESLGLSPAFETARMYRGPDPELPLERIFGISTFELG